MIDEDKLNALELFGENEYLHKEIERLNKMLEETIKEYEHKQYITDLITENGIIRQKNKEIERLHKENEILRHRLEVANEYIDSRKENMIIDHVIDLKYIINECDLESTW